MEMLDLEKPKNVLNKSGNLFSKLRWTPVYSTLPSWPLGSWLTIGEQQSRRTPL